MGSDGRKFLVQCPGLRGEEMRAFAQGMYSVVLHPPLSRAQKCLSDPGPGTACLALIFSGRCVERQGWKGWDERQESGSRYASEELHTRIHGSTLREVMISQGLVVW
jgi:hypothetical protein